MAFSKIAAENLGGSNLPAIGGASLTGLSADFKLIQSQSTTSAASLSFTTSFDGTYDTHMFVVNDLKPSDYGQQFVFRILTIV